MKIKKPSKFRQGKSIFCAIIAMVMLMVCVEPVMAEESAFTLNAHADDYAGKTYTEFGDSIAAGFNLSENMEVMGYGECQTAYPALLANALGMNHYAYSAGGFRTSEILRMLGGDVQDDAYFNFWQNYYNGSWFQAQENIGTIVNDSSLVTIQIGANDILMYPVINSAIKILEMEEERKASDELIETTFGELSVADVCTLLQEKLDKLADTFNANEQLVEMLQFMNDIGYYNDYVELVVESIGDGIYNLNSNFDAIMQKLCCLKGADSTVMVVGLYNPYRGVSLLDDGMIEIGWTMEAAVQTVNSFMCAEALKYGFTYVDISETECYSSGQSMAAIGTSASSGDFDTSKVDPHPTATGNHYIAQRIIDELPHTFTEEVVAPTCTSLGYTIHRCECGECYNDCYVPFADHQFEAKVVAPTYTSTGYTKYTCVNCGFYYKADFQPKLVYTAVIRRAVQVIKYSKRFSIFR